VVFVLHVKFRIYQVFSGDYVKFRIYRFSLGTPDSSTTKTDCHDITEILIKETLNTITL
jgi:hypothetical protein